MSRALFVAGWAVTIASPLLIVLMVRLCCWAAGSPLTEQGAGAVVFFSIFLGICAVAGRILEMVVHRGEP